jgi:Carboxypeptidase regulatory-like domain
MIVAAFLLTALAQAPAGPATLSGRVVDAQGQPAAGAEVLLSGIWRGREGPPVLARAKSDQKGRFRIEAPGEKDPKRSNSPLAVWAYSPQLGLAGQSFSPSALPAPGSVQLKLGGPVQTTVRVVGPDARRIAGARVAPVSVRVAGGIRPDSRFPLPDPLAGSLAATTDADGKGQIGSCRAEDMDAVWVEAAGFGLQGSELGAADEGVHVIKLQPVGRLRGRVQADDPSALRALEIRALTRPRASAGPHFLGEGRATTDSEGRFEIPALAAGKLALNALPADGSKLRARPPADLTVEPGKTTEVTIPLESPPRERTVTGRVVDGGGQPIAGATVFQSGDSPARTESQTGADGRFRLSGVVARPTFLFARKAGYRFGGLAIAPESEDVKLVIHKREEPPRLVRKTLPSPLSRQEELALARRLLDPYAERVLKDGGEQEKVRTLQVLARVEPERGLELIQKKVFSAPYFNSMISLALAQGLMDQSVDEAMVVLEGVEDPGPKAIGYIEASSRLDARNRAQALDVLERALLNARVAKDPDGMKLVLLGRVAERFLDLGAAERGRAILREGEALAKQLPKAGFAGYARGAFAEELAQIDLEAALALTKDLANPREIDRHHGNIAHELARLDPAQSERVLAMVKHAFERDDYAVRVVYRMAPLDLARARRLADSIGDDGLRGYALGMMALGLAGAGKDSARQALENAYESLERSSQVSPEKSKSFYASASIAAVLLPVAERIDPGLLEEELWRALAMRQPKPWARDPTGRPAEADVLLGMTLARYDRAIARSLVESVIRGMGPTPGFLSLRGELHAAAAAIDPNWAVALVEALPDDPDLKLQNPKNSARLAVADVLGRAGDLRFRKFQHSFMMLWVPDIEDNDPWD